MPAPDLFLYCREQILVTGKYTPVLKEFEKAVLRAASSFPMDEDILLDYAMRWFQVSARTALHIAGHRCMQKSHFAAHWAARWST